MKLSTIAKTSRSLSETSSRNEKVALLVEILRACEPEEIAVTAGFLIGEPLAGKVGVGYATVRDVLRQTAPATESSLSVGDVSRALHTVAEVSGRGSKQRREDELGKIFAAATADERDFLAALLVGDLRQGALEGVMVTAVARAAGVKVSTVRRALMFCGSLPEVARAAMTDGKAGLRGFTLQLFRPLKPMLARPADSLGSAVELLGDAALEYKLDGARIQVHRQGERVAVYTRNLNDVTASVPEVVEAALRFPTTEFVIDGEVLAFGDDGTPETFQTTMRRFGRTENVEQMRRELPLTAYFFDALLVDGQPLVDEAAADRWAVLEELTGRDAIVPRLVTSDAQAAADFFERALDEGHEGLLAKSLDTAYDAGRRGKSWFKIKPSHTLDLVILAAEWGSGRREGTLSNLHLGARDPETGSFVMLGKTFKGLTDEMLEWQTNRLLELELAREGHVVHVAPELVVEIAFDGVQDSPRYPGGVALRFARVKRYRAEKSPSEADTIEAVRCIRAGESGNSST